MQKINLDDMSSDIIETEIGTILVYHRNKFCHSKLADSLKFQLLIYHGITM